MRYYMTRGNMENYKAAAFYRMFPLSVLLLCLFIAPSSSGESIQADKILVEKAKRVLTLYSGDEPIKKYRVALVCRL
jgi:hypothetical protein